MGTFAWALATVEVHAWLGWLLWKQDLKILQPGIPSAIRILALRFFTGVALFVTGVVMNPQAKEVFAALWSGFFLILFAAESFFFFQGVQEL